MSLIGYAKMGRSYNLDPAKATSVGGDIDVLNALVRLATKHPEHTFVLVGKNSGEDPQTFGLPENIINPWSEWRKFWKTPLDPKNADEAILLFRSMTGNWHERLDHLIVWAGQHGSANSRIPMIGSNWINPPGNEPAPGRVFGDNSHNDIITGGEGENLATPQFAFVNYCSPILDFISRWREAGPGPLYREEIWLCPDPRNYLKCREKRWPLRYPVIAQYDFLRYHKGERYGRFPAELELLDPTGYRENSLWVSNVAYCYAGLELTAVRDPETLAFDPRPGPHRFGMVVNENLVGVKDSRLELLKTWILPNFPDAEVRGHWTEGSQIDLGRVINPVPYIDALKTMKSFATTITTPASGSEWATAKPWESFAIGSVCFFHPRYDGQGHILPLKNGRVGRALVSEDSKMLASYLRVENAAMLKERVDEVTSNNDLYYALVTAQRRHYEAAFDHWDGGALAISDRIMADLARVADQTLIRATLNHPEAWLNYTQPPAAKVQSRATARPRGTNEERKKKKPPISRRRALREDMLNETAVVDDVVHEASNGELEDNHSPSPAVLRDMPAEEPRGIFHLRSYGDVQTEEELIQLTKPVALTAAQFDFRGVEAVTKPFTFSVTNLDTLVPELVRDTGRQSKDAYFLDIAKKVATQTTCARRAVGCVLVNSKKHILATGFNGVPRGMPHCNEGSPCKGANMPSGQGLSDCLSVHAEINALVQCREVDDIETVYLTVSPCKDCIKVIMNTGVTRIVFAEEYVQPEAKALWLRRKGNEWIKL